MIIGYIKSRKKSPNNRYIINVIRKRKIPIFLKYIDDGKASIIEISEQNPIIEKF